MKLLAKIAFLTIGTSFLAITSLGFSCVIKTGRKMASGNVRPNDAGHSAKWQVSDIPGADALGRLTSVAINEQGNPVVIIERTDFITLWLGTCTESSWSIKTFEPASNILLFGLTRNPSGSLWLWRYLGHSGGLESLDLTSATKDWSPIPFEGGFVHGIGTDRNGNIHIVYTRKPSKIQPTNIRQLGWDARIKVWNSEDVAENVDSRSVSVALDSNGVPHVAYFDPDGYLHHASKINGKWNIESFTEPIDGKHFWSSIAVSKKGSVAISFNSDADSKVKYVEINGGKWSEIETVDNEPSFSSYDTYPALDFDDYNVPHIIYDYITFNGGSAHQYEAIRHASRLGGKWEIDQIDMLKGQQMDNEFCGISYTISNNHLYVSYSVIPGDLRHDGPIKLASTEIIKGE